MKEPDSDDQNLFDKYRMKVGLFLGPLIFIVIILLPTPQSFIQISQKMLSATIINSEVIETAYSAQVVLALLFLMIVWWITEAVPIPITSLLPGIILPIFHVIGFANNKTYLFDSKNVFANYSNPVIYLFLGGFLLAGAMQKTGLDKRFTGMLCQSRLADIIYISCSADTLCRDLKILQQGGYEVISARMIDMFPRTKHFESVTYLRKI